jgi:hypothetical protein
MAISALVLVVMWAPWITDEYAINQVVDMLGGPDARFEYLGENMAVKDVPKSVVWMPFARAVYFPSEAVLVRYILRWYISLVRTSAEVNVQA